MENQFESTSQQASPISQASGWLKERRSGGGTPQGNAQKPRWPLFLGLGLLGLLVLAIIGLFSVNAVLEGQYTGKIDPGISISGVYVGEMTPDQAKTKLSKELENYTTKPVTLTFQDKTWTPSLDQLGVTINLDSSLEQAQSFSKTGDFFKDFRILKQLSPQAHNVPLEIQLDESKLHGFLGDISDRIRTDTVEPVVKLSADGKLEITPGKDGFNVDYDATFAAIKKNLQSMTVSNENLLKVHDVPPVITQQELDDFQAQVAPFLSGPVTVSFKDKSWTFDQKQIAAQLKISENPSKSEPRHLSYTFDTAFFEKYIGGLSKEINQEPKDAQVGWNGKQLVYTKPSQNGQYLSVPRTMDNLNQAFRATDPEKRKTTLWVDIREPAINSEDTSKFGNLELLGQGVSSFGGSAYERSTNIKVGSQHLTGAIIKPHSTFSFLDAIGDISVKEGYVQGYSIVADQTVPDVGGGICQVATTTFRAAFYAGLPIVERHPHAYRVSWYEEMGEPVGFDAAVYQPGVDLKFDNPTDKYMVVVAYTENGKLYVNVLGTKTEPNQTVELIHNGITNVKNAPPDRTEVDPSLAPGQRKQVDYAHKGLTTSVTRVVKVNGVEVKRETFGSTYAPWPNIFKVGPDKKPDPTPAPAATPSGDQTKQGQPTATPTPKS
ncbi:MAG TPA: VanW family protein [Chloroflexia bacterium]|nr:VanW family protein [Chloroflexia bacterium]